MCNYASAACRHLPQGGKKIRPNQEVHFQSRVWGQVDLTAATAKVHQTIRALDSTGFQSQIIVEEVVFHSLSFYCSTCSKDPPMLNSLLIWKNIPRQFSFLVAKPSEATIWRLLVYLLLGPCCFLACSHFILLEWPSSGGQALPHLHIVTSKKSKSGPDPKNSKSGPDPKNPRGLDPKEKMNFPILQQASPLDQVLAKVCKSLNEVVCLTFCSLIPFYTEIPAVNIEWKILEIWIAGFLFSKVAHVTQAAGLRHMNNFCISASFPHTYTNIPGIASHCLPEVEQRNIAR